MVAPAIPACSALIVRRIRAVSFDLVEYVALEPDVSTHALHRGERIFVGRKPATEGATDG